jgi:hypothetical protein
MEIGETSKKREPEKTEHIITQKPNKSQVFIPLIPQIPFQSVIAPFCVVFLAVRNWT